MATAQGNSFAYKIKEHLRSSDMDNMFYVENGILSFSIGGEEFIHKKVTNVKKFDEQLESADGKPITSGLQCQVRLSDITSESPIQGDVSALADLFEQLQSSASNMIAKHFTLSNFKAGLSKLDMKCKDSFFGDIFFESESDELTHSKVWERLHVHWSFLNITLLEHIINEFEDEELQFNLEDCIEKLMEFQCRVHLHDFIECSTPTYTALRDEKFTELAIQLNRCQAEYKLDDLDEVTEFIASKFVIPKFFLILKDVEISGIIITWAVPSIVKAYMREVIDTTDLRLFCKRHKITSITVASEKYKYSTANIVTEVSTWCRKIESPLPNTMTQLYTAYTCKLMSQYFKAKGKDCIIESLENIPMDLRAHFLKLCQVAWEGIVEKKIVFSSSTVSGDNTLGLIEEVKGECDLLTYHFSHRILQEFLSAYHIAQLPLKTQECVILDKIKDKEMKAVIRFYFGLTKHHKFTSKMISDHLESELISAHQWSREVSAGPLQSIVPPSSVSPPPTPFPFFPFPAPARRTSPTESTGWEDTESEAAAEVTLSSSNEERELELAFVEVTNLTRVLQLLGLTPPSSIKVPGQENLFFLFDSSCYECLNDDDDHPLSHAFDTATSEQYLQSSVDDQLIISVSFQEPVKLHSLQITSPPDGRAPKNIKIFINQPNILDFSQAKENIALQEISLTEKDVTEKATIPLYCCKYQSVQNIMLFIMNNQGNKETTAINHLAFFGLPQKGTIDMSRFQCVSGEEGEKHKHAWDPCIDRNR